MIRRIKIHVSFVPRHITIYHTDDKKEYKCELCSQKFEVSYNLRRHFKKVHQSQSVQCNLCNKSLRKENLPYHVRSVHNQEKTHKCEYCEKEFFYKKILREHINSLHSKDAKEKYECGLCKEVFTNKSNRDRHFRTRHQNNQNTKFNCTLCEKSFTQKLYMQKHIERIHNRQKI